MNDNKGAKPELEEHCVNAYLCYRQFHRELVNVPDVWSHVTRTTGAIYQPEIRKYT